MLGVVWAAWLMLKIIITRFSVEEQREKLKEQIAQRIHDIQLEKIEEQGNVLLAYDKDDNRFLGQAHSVDDLKQVLMQRWPDKIFILNGEPFSALEKAQ